MSGMLSILNVYEGDLEIKFDNSKPAEVEHARKVISDMLRRGYALLVEVDGAYQRAVGFDEKACAYIIAEKVPEDVQKKEESKGKRPKATRRRSISIVSSRAVGIARSAGG